jgi:hypothetical protein
MKKWSDGVIEKIRRKYSTRSKIVFALALYAILFAPGPSPSGATAGEAL